MNIAYLKVTCGLRFHLFFFFLGAGLLMSFHGHSCPSIMIIYIQPQRWGASGRGRGNNVSRFFFFSPPPPPPPVHATDLKYCKCCKSLVTWPWTLTMNTWYIYIYILYSVCACQREFSTWQVKWNEYLLKQIYPSILCSPRLCLLDPHTVKYIKNSNIVKSN